MYGIVLHVYRVYIVYSIQYASFIAYIKPLLDNLAATSAFFDLARCDLHVAILHHMPWILSEPFHLIETAVPYAARARDHRSGHVASDH